MLFTRSSYFHVLALNVFVFDELIVFTFITEDDLCDNGDEDSWSSFSQNNYNGNLVRSTSYIFLETILEETSDDLRTDSERSSEEGIIFTIKIIKIKYIEY